MFTLLIFLDLKLLQVLFIFNGGIQRKYKQNVILPFSNSKFPAVQYHDISFFLCNLHFLNIQKMIFKNTTFTAESERKHQRRGM